MKYTWDKNQKALVEFDAGKEIQDLQQLLDARPLLNGATTEGIVRELLLAADAKKWSDEEQEHYGNAQKMIKAGFSYYDKRSKSKSAEAARQAFKVLNDFWSKLCHSIEEEDLPMELEPGLTDEEMFKQINAKSAKYDYDPHKQAVYIVIDNKCEMCASGSAGGIDIGGMPIEYYHTDTSGDVLHSHTSAASFQNAEGGGWNDPYAYIAQGKRKKYEDFSNCTPVCQVYADETGIYLLDRHSSIDACKPTGKGTFYTRDEVDDLLGPNYDESTLKENTKITLTIGQLRRLVKEGYSYWSHGDCFTGWDDMAWAIKDKWGKKINDMTEDEKHKAYVDFALRDYGCNPVHIQSSMIDCTKGAASRWASDLVWGNTSDWPTQLPAADELVKRFEAYSRDRALREFVDEVKEELEEHDLKAADMKGWLEDEVKKNPRVAKYLKAPDIGSIKDYEKESLEMSFKEKFIDSIGAKMWKVYGGKEGIRKAFYSMGCYDELGDHTFTDRQNYYTHEKIPAETSPEQLCADWDNFVSQMGFDGAPEWAMELLYQRGYYKYYAAGNTSWSNPGGRNPKRTYADLKSLMSGMSAVAENSNITLTIGQLKRLVKEYGSSFRYRARHAVQGIDGEWYKKHPMGPKPIDRDKFHLGKQPKDENQAIYFMHQMVGVALGKLDPPSGASATLMDVFNAFCECCDVLGKPLTPEQKKFVEDKVSDTQTYPYTEAVKVLTDLEKWVGNEGMLKRIRERIIAYYKHEKGTPHRQDEVSFLQDILGWLAKDIDKAIENKEAGYDPYTPIGSGGMKVKDDDSIEITESYRHYTQRDLRQMVRSGDAIDITNYSLDQAKDLRSRGYDIVGVCTGTYGLNGALLQMRDTGDLCALICRNTILSYLV